jgi:hypothetical protein
MAKNQPMPLTLLQKFRIPEGMKILAVNAPPDCITRFHSFSDQLQISGKIKDYQQIHWFVRNKEEMEKELNRILTLLKEGVICWIFYPKGTSKMQTNLTRDKGWESLLKHKDLQWISLISFDETWSAFGMRRITENQKKKTGGSKPRPIFQYVDPVTKTIRMPEDLEQAMKKNKIAKTFYENLSFTNKKEYVEWVITAKREETRKERIQGTLERLEKNWNNPRNL